MKKLLLLLLSVVLFSCATTTGDVIATVEDHKITQTDFDTELAKLKKMMIPEDYVLTEEEENTFRSQVLNNMIMKYLYTAKMDELDIQADESIIDQQIAQLQTQYESEEAMIAAIEARGYTLEELKKESVYQLRVSELSKYASESDEIEVTSEDVESFYNENKESIFAQDAVIQNARHILVTTDDKSEEEALAKIQEIRAEIVNGLDFAEAAKEFSEGPSGPNGGALGQFTKGQMVPEFETVAFNIPVNEVSQPVLTQFGYHLILVEGRTDKSYATLEETTDYITSRIKVETFFNEIEESAKITKPDWANTEA